MAVLMNDPEQFEVFLVGTPGLESPLADEARALGFANVVQVPGGVTLTGGWPEIWRANLSLRGATRVLVRIAQFRAMHPAQLDKRARKIDWASFLRPDVAVSVEATCRKSRIYHAGAAKSRVERAIAEELGATIAPKSPISVKVRIEDDLCTISLDTSGESLHKRGHKEAVNKAPLRETMAAMFLRAAGFDGKEPIYDPMCGSGTLPIEAAEIASGQLAGRARSFAFEHLATFDPKQVETLKTGHCTTQTDLRFWGSDRDAGAIKMCDANAERAGVSAITHFECKPISEVTAPDGPPGLVILNPPYGARISKKNMLYGLYAATGARLKSEFRGWRVALITTEAGLAKSTDLPFQPPGPIVAHGGLKVRLWQTGPLG